MHASRVLAALIAAGFVLTLTAAAGCEGALSPELNPQRVVIGFLKDVGRGSPDATKWVTPDAARQIESWKGLLIFPDHATPPSPSEEEQIDRFISLCYRVTMMDEGETEATVHLVFAGTDAIVGFPSVANNPSVPNVAPFQLTLVRTKEGEGKKARYGDWRISAFQTITSSR